MKFSDKLKASIAEDAKRHPATMWPTRWLFHNRSDQVEEIQIIDILTDIRNILVFWIILWTIF